MSNGSTSKIGSGDGKSNKCKKVCPKAYSDYKGIRDIEGGPYGDSPPEQQNQARRDYFIFMLEENEESPELSEFDDQELYDLKNDYLEKLNVVRKRLNLIELKDSDSDHSSVQRGCTITEIIEEEEEEEEEVEEEEQEEEEVEESEAAGTSSKENSSKSVKSTKSAGVEITTIYPFSLSYNSGSKSEQSDPFEIEYNPPKKKSCYRIKTPVPTVSDNSIPYHTKVSLHEDLFRNDISLCPSVWREAVSKFTENKGTQCSEEYLIFSRNCSQVASTATQKSLENEGNTNNVNLFPEVIIKETPRELSGTPAKKSAKEKTPKFKTIYSERRKSNEVFSPKETEEQECRRASTPPKSPGFFSKTPFSRNVPVNVVADPTEESYETVSSNLTVVEHAYVSKKKRSSWKRRAKKTTMWNDLPDMDVSMNGNSKRKFRKRHNFLTEYISYHKRRPHTCPPDTKEPVIFGPVNLSNFTAYQPESFYYFSTDTDWHSSKFSVDTSPENTQPWWKKMFCCFPPVWRYLKNKKR